MRRVYSSNNSKCRYFMSSCTGTLEIKVPRVCTREVSKKKRSEGEKRRAWTVGRIKYQFDEFTECIGEVTERAWRGVIIYLRLMYRVISLIRNAYSLRKMKDLRVSRDLCSLSQNKRYVIN